jgi:hypothetical protein
MPKVYLAAIMGQGGWLTSYGVARMAKTTEQLGIQADVFAYGDTDKIAAAVDAHRTTGYLIAGLGYSLGVSALTYAQSSFSGHVGRKFDLVLCVAGSRLGQNYPIDHAKTTRSVLWRGPGVLSGAGGDLGFDVVHDVAGAPHLWMDFAPEVATGVEAELGSLLGGTRGVPDGVSAVQKR